MIVNLEHVVKRYGRGTQVLDSLDLTVETGEFLAIVGPSGCGKTTLLNLIGALDRPDAGRIEVCGADLGAMDDRALSAFRNTTVGFIFQSYHLHPRLNTIENTMLPALAGAVPTAQARRRATRNLSAVGLDEFAQRMPHTLSGGQMQRVAIARALMMSPKILLADEPTGNLDQDAGGALLERLTQLNGEEGMTVIAVTHEPEIRRYATRMLVMRNGKLKEEPGR